MISTTWANAQVCHCYKPRPQRENERLELQCHQCGRTVEVAPDAKRCPYCAAQLEIDIKPEARS